MSELSLAETAAIWQEYGEGLGEWVDFEAGIENFDTSFIGERLDSPEGVGLLKQAFHKSSLR